MTERIQTAHAQRHCEADDAVTTVRLCSVLRLQLRDRGRYYARRRYELWDGEARLTPPNTQTGDQGEIRALIPDVDELELRVWFDAGDIPEIYHLRFERAPSE